MTDPEAKAAAMEIGLLLWKLERFNLKVSTLAALYKLLKGLPPT